MALIFIAAVLTTYSNTLQCPFIFDDLPNIVNNGFLKIQDFSFNSIAYVWQSPHPLEQRKLSYLTFALNHLWGGNHPFTYHLVNILIHACCGLLSARFFALTLRTDWLVARYGSISPWLSWGAAFLWVLHPIQGDAVTYIVQRMTSLAVLFALLAMIGWLSGRMCWVKGKRAKALVCFGSGAMAWILGLLCKEHVAIVPMLILVHEFILIRQGRFLLKWQWILVGGLVFAGFLFCYGEGWRLGNIFSGYADRDFDLLERLMTEARVLWYYLSLFFFPLADRYSLLHEFSISRGLFSPVTTIICILAWCGVIASAWIYRRRWPMFAWMSAWFLTAHLIESTIIPLQIIFEHRMYLPSIGLAFGSVILFYDLLSKRLPRPRLQAALLVSAIFLFGLATYASNMDLRNDVSLYRDELGRYPNSKRIRLCLATALTRSGSFAEAGRLLKALVLEHPDDIQVLQNWHNFLSNVPGDAEAADLVYQHIVQLMNRDRHMSRFDVEAVWSLANFFFRSNDFQDASFLMNHILIDFKYNHLWFLKGRCHAALGEWDLALGAFHRAWEEKPKDPSTLYWYGKSLIKVGEHDKGCKMLELIAQSPINVDATRMGRELLEKDCERGLEQF